MLSVKTPELTNAALALVSATNKQTEEIKKQTTLLFELVNLVKRAMRPSRPQLTVTAVREIFMAKVNKIVYVVQVPALGADHDVVKRALKVNGDVVFDAPYESSMDTTPYTFPEFSIKQDEVFTVEAQDVDDSGNVGSSGVQTFTAKDVFAPQSVEGMTLNPVREEFEEVPDAPTEG
jgi:hypothetical protein